MELPPPPARVSHRMQVWAVAGAGAVLLAHALLILVLTDQHLRALLSNLILPLESSCAGAALILSAVRRRAVGRRLFFAWLMLGVSYSLMALGDIGWLVLETYSGTAPFPSVADIVYVLSYPAFFTGVALLSPRPGTAGERIRRILDVGIILLSIALLVLVSFLAPILAHPPEGSPVFDVLAVLYPLADFALVSGFVILIFGGPQIMAGGVRWLLMGSILGQIIGDWLFSYQSLAGLYASGNVLDLAYAVSYCCAFCAALRRLAAGDTPRPATDEGSVPPRKTLIEWRSYLPFLGILGVFIFLFLNRLDPIPVSNSVLAAWTGAIILLSLTRQVLTRIDGDRLKRQLSASRDELDSRVTERTAMLIEANLELALLDRARTALAREIDLSVVVKTIVETVAGTLGYSMVCLYLREGDTLALSHQVGYSRFHQRIPITQGVTGRVARTGRAEIVTDGTRDPDFLLVDEGVVSEVSVPLVDQGEVSGVLTVESRQVAFFDEKDLRLLTAVADFATIAVARARLFTRVQESEERYRRLIDTSPDAIVLTDAETGILIANQKAAELFGYDRPFQLAQRSVLDLVDAADRERLDAALHLVLGRASVASLEVHVTDSDGATSTLEARASAVTGVDGALTGLQVVARDITERRRIETELRLSREELERRIEERTAALKESQERLRQGEKMEAIGQLAGGVAHDFNNLLMVIIGHSQMLIDAGDLPAHRQKDVAAMLESAQRAAALTRQLLAFSRRQTMEYRAIDLNAVLVGMEEMAGRLVGEHVRLEIRSQPGLWSVLSDLIQMEQVVLNLASNASDAMPDGGVLEISTANVELAEPLPARPEHVPPGRYVLLTVRDSGQGMTMEVQEHVFEPFFTTKKEGKGTGLGLATVYGIVKQTKGFIRLESAPGQGTTFGLYLPAQGEAAEARPDEAGSTEIPGGSERILVVDDQPGVRRVVARMLTRLGYTVHEAGSGQEALAIISRLSQPVDLVLTDISMPEMTGPVLARQVAQGGRVPQTILMSGYASDAAGRSMTDERFIQKPFTSKALALAVRNALDRRD